MITAVTVLKFLFFFEDNVAWFSWSRFISSENATLKMGEDKFEEEKFMKALVNLKDTQESIQVRQLRQSVLLTIS